MMKSLLGAALAAALMVAGAAVAQEKKAGAPDKQGEKFLTEAIQGNLAEIEMGKLAQQKGQSDAVKSFGKMLETDHGDALQKASALASAGGMTPPTQPNAKQKAEHDRMARMSGGQFDREFGKMMVADHKKDIAAYEKAARNNDDVGKYAKESLPVLQKHLKQAESLTVAPAPTGSR
jgi:putative membrane protein